jgi:hypothetical protein
MVRNKRWQLSSLCLCVALLGVSGCRDALREGVTTGVRDGLAGLVETWIDTYLTGPMVEDEASG